MIVIVGWTLLLLLLLFFFISFEQSKRQWIILACKTQGVTFVLSDLFFSLDMPRKKGRRPPYMGIVKKKKKEKRICRINISLSPITNLLIQQLSYMWIHQSMLNNKGHSLRRAVDLVLGNCLFRICCIHIHTYIYMYVYVFVFIGFFLNSPNVLYATRTKLCKVYAR